jgi:hypothetical protein
MQVAVLAETFNAALSCIAGVEPADGLSNDSACAAILSLTKQSRIHWVCPRHGA